MHTATGLRRVELNECGHPEPDECGIKGAERIAAIASQAQRGDLVICLISGGASALLPLPAPPVTSGAEARISPACCWPPAPTSMR